MKTQIEKRDVNGMPLWITHEIVEEGGAVLWQGTGRDMLSMLHVSARDAISFFIGQYPSTSEIRAYSKTRYEHIDLSEAARAVMIDGVMAKLTAITGGDSDASPTLFDKDVKGD